MRYDLCELCQKTLYLNNQIMSFISEWSHVAKVILLKQYLSKDTYEICYIFSLLWNKIISTILTESCN